MDNVVTISNVVFDFDEDKLRSRFLEICKEHSNIYKAMREIFKYLFYISAISVALTTLLLFEFEIITLGLCVILAVVLSVFSMLVFKHYREKLYNISISQSMCVGIGDGFENTIKAIENLCGACDGSIYELEDLYTFNCIWYISEIVKRNEPILLDVNEPYIYAGNKKRGLALDLSEPKDLEDATLYITTDNIYVM